MQKRLLFVFGLLLCFGSAAFAQDNLLNYGDTLIGRLSTSNPVGTYTFNGSTGDVVSIEVIGVGIDPAVRLNAPDEQQLASSDNDAMNPGSPDARINLSLPQDGLYSMNITGTPGQFLLRLNGQPPAVGRALTNMPMLADITAGPQAQVFTFSADPAVPTTLNISSAAPDFSFRAVIRAASGQITALITQSTGIVFTLPLGERAYTVEIAPSDPASSGQISIGLGPAAAVAPPVQDDTACMVSAQGSAPVNIRSGPGVDFESLGLLEPGTRIAVTGVSGTWYQVDMPGVGLGWVRRDVVTGFGLCDDVPQMTEAPEATVEATALPITETFTPTSTATETPTAAATPTAAPSETPTDDVTPTAIVTPSSTPSA